MENWQKWKLQWLRKPLQEQFEISVIVAKGLPKDRVHIIGHKNVLNFFAFYKQATRGPCQVEKPKIIDVSKRAKWDAWKKLGNTPIIHYKQRFISNVFETSQSLRKIKQSTS